MRNLRERLRAQVLSPPLCSSALSGLITTFSLQPPLYFLVMAGVYRVLGFSETVARLGSAIPYLAGIVAVFFLVRSLANRGSTAVSVIMLCGHRPGRSGHSPPLVRLAMAMNAAALWKPRARVVRAASWVLVPSVRALLNR